MGYSVYKLVFTDGCIYIGKCSNLKARVATHKWCARQPGYYGMKVARAIALSPLFPALEVLVEGLTKEEAIAEEKRQIEIHSDQILLNSNLGGSGISRGTTGARRVSEAHKKSGLRPPSQKGTKQTQEWMEPRMAARRRPITDGTTVWGSVAECAASVGLSTGYISNAAKSGTPVRGRTYRYA